MANAVAKTPKNLPDVPEEYVPGVTGWNDGADTVAGADLLNAENGLIDSLLGIPFMVTKVTFNPGKGKIGEVQKAMVSVEAVIAPEDVLKRRRINMADLPFEPGDQIVFNDGSTGIYRQVVAYLAAKGWIELPEGATDGKETVTDLPPSGWAEIHAGECWTKDDGFLRYEIPVRLTCPRGLRISEYTSDYGDARTRYIA